LRLPHLRVQQFGQAEIRQLDRPVRADQDVRRFQVAVDDLVLVGKMDRPRQGLHQ
jgi:hypothetical protein